MICTRNFKADQKGGAKAGVIYYRTIAKESRVASAVDWEEMLGRIRGKKTSRVAIQLRCLSDRTKEVALSSTTTNLGDSRDGRRSSQGQSADTL